MPYAAQHADSLRFEVSSVEVLHMSVVGAIPGITPLAAAAVNGPGRGLLRSLVDGQFIAWRAPGSSVFGTPVRCGADGDYLVEDGEDRDKWFRIRVSVSDMLNTPAQSSVYIQDLYNNAAGSDDVTDVEASAGDVATYTIDMANVSVKVVSGLAVWVDSATAGIEISDDGVAWVAPTTEATALAFGNIATGASITLHLRRTIPAAAGADPSVLNILKARFNA